jgi:cytochrome bd-type quinol oxidase subunit 2
MPGIIQFNPIDLVNQLIAYTLLVAGLLAIIFIIYGGLLFITAAGNEERTQKAMHTIKYAIIGLVVCIMSFTIVYYLGQFFNYDFINYISIDAIMETMEGIGEKFGQY